VPAAKPKPAIHPFDVAHGTDTSGLIPGKTIIRGTTASIEEVTAYYGIAPSILHGLLDIWLQRCHPQASIENTVLIDVGAGKGRAALLASEYPFLRVDGIELNPTLARIAKANLALWQKDRTAEPLTAVDIYQADATTHPLPASATLAFLFHPFEAPTLRRYLKHVEDSLRANPRPFDLLYANAEHDSLLDRNPAFQQLWIGRVAMSTEDHLADLAAIAEQKEYGSTGDELCAIYRYVGRATAAKKPR
jgi:SAM-dependent methyltransferase